MRLGLVASALCAASAASGPLISERNVLLPPACTIQLTVTGGKDECFDWTSDRPDLARVSRQWCEGGASYAEVVTGAASQARAFVSAHPKEANEAAAGDDDFDSEPLVCEVNVAEVHSLQLLTTTRRMFTHELQWLQVGARDERSNAFSDVGLRTLPFRWRFSPSGGAGHEFLEYYPPLNTGQQLGSHHAALTASDARARSYYRRAVLATNPIPAVAVAVELGGAGRAVHTAETVSVEPSSLRLTPAGKVHGCARPRARGSRRGVPSRRP